MSRAVHRPSARTGRHGLATALVVTMITVAVSGCGLFTRNSPTVAGPRAVPHSPTVVLLGAGSGPRRALRFDPTVGAVSELDLRVDLHLTQHLDAGAGTTTGSGAGRAEVIDPPATHHRVRFTVTGADDDGHEVAFEVIDAGVDPEGTILTDVQVVELTAAVQQLVGLRGQMRIDRRGAVASISYDTAPAAGDASDSERATALLRDVEGQLASVVPVVPLEPVGRGARWRTTSRSTLAGIDVRQTTTYEITAIDGDQVLYRATVTQDAGEQALHTTAPDQAPGPGDARLLATAVTGTTTGRLSLTDLTSEHETRLVGAQVLEVGDEPTRRVRQELDLVVTVWAPAP